MNRLLFLIVAFSAPQAFGQPDIKDKLVGDWSTSLAAGDSGLFHFNSDGSMFIVTPTGIIGKGEIVRLNDGRMVKSLMRYVINTNVKPIEINFYYALDTYFNVIGKAEGIIELLDDDLLRIAINYNRPPVRPQNFDNPTETGVLSRKGKRIEVEDCDRFRQGHFWMTDSFVGTTRIVRDNEVQIESNDLGDKVKLQIEWTSDCTYTLTPIEFLVDNNWVADTTGIVQDVQIIKTRTDSYIFSTGNNKTTLRTTRELFVAEN